MDLNRFAIKIFAAEPMEVELPELIPIFHRWIQTHAVEGLLIDVADYSHVVDGPGILLIGHEANYAFDRSGGRSGLLYARKRPIEGPLAERLYRSTDLALRACRELERAPELAGRLKFRGDQLAVVANDRLLAPNTEAAWGKLEPELTAFLSRLLPGARCDLEREPDPKGRLGVTVNVVGPGLLERPAA